jgi:hypothetical protein
MYETDVAAELVEEVLQEETGGDHEGAYEVYGEGTSQEEELASELLELSSDHELDHFFGKVFKGVTKFIKSPTGKLLTGALRGLAKKALPIAGSALGNLVVPGLGGMVGGNLAGGLGSAIGLEGEGLVGEEEQEVAKRVVRVAQQAARQVAQDPQAAVNPREAVKSAVSNAVRSHLPAIAGTGQAGIEPPGLLQGQAPGRRSGRWIRRGNRIVLLGV